MQSMLLEKLLEALVVKSVKGDVQGEVSGLVHDSRKVRPGTLFFSISGRRTQGWRYAREAIERGARAVVVDRDCPIKGAPLVRVCRPTEGYRIIADRKEAIRAAIDEAGSGDLVLIAGKGHETEQIYQDRMTPFNDRQVAQELIMTKLKEEAYPRSCRLEPVKY